MKTLRFRSIIMFGLLALWGSSIATAANISGTYSDKGTMLADGSPTVSLHALFGLQFQPEVGLADHMNTATVEVTDKDDWFEFKTYQEGGTEISRSRWGPQNGFSHEEGSAVVRISKNKDEFYTFMLKSAADGAAMEVRIYRVSPSTFGPAADPIGTYFFVKSE